MEAPQWSALTKAQQRAWVVARFLDEANPATREGEASASAGQAAMSFLLLTDAANGPKHALAGDLASAVRPWLDRIDAWMMRLEVMGKMEALPTEWRDRIPGTLDELDGALALLARDVFKMLRRRARSSRNASLLCEAVVHAIGNGPEAATLLRRIHALRQDEVREEDGRISDGGWVGAFVWDAYVRTEALDRLADEFPEHLGASAREMRAWPMLWHRHGTRKKRFDELAERLELGKEHPLEVSQRAKFKPDTPMVAYVDGLVDRLHHLWFAFQQSKEWPERLRVSEAEERTHIRWLWNDWPDEPLADEVIAVLQVCWSLPPLTKATAGEWIDQAVMPLILVTDGRDYRNVTEPALRQIARQNGVKSQATFVSRLKPEVRRTLLSMARAE